MEIPMLEVAVALVINALVRLVVVDQVVVELQQATEIQVLLLVELEAVAVAVT
jgi:hypothetical protein